MIHLIHLIEVNEITVPAYKVDQARTKSLEGTYKYMDKMENVIPEDYIATLQQWARKNLNDKQLREMV